MTLKCSTLWETLQKLKLYWHIWVVPFRVEQLNSFNKKATRHKATVKKKRKKKGESTVLVSSTTFCCIKMQTAPSPSSLTHFMWMCFILIFW